MKKKNLTFKFTLMFASFIILTLIISAIFSLLNQQKVYKQQREENVQFVASYLEELIMADDIYFVWYQNYFLEKADSLLVPYDFDTISMQDARHDYEEALSHEHPGLVLGTDIDFDDLSEETKNAYEVYSHEYYLSAFEKACGMFNLKHIYYLVPKNDGTDDMIYVLDSRRKVCNVGGKLYIDLGITNNYPKSKFERLWEAWETGKRPKGYDIFENKNEKTYAYYTPLYINGEKLGVIDVEVEVSELLHAIHMETLRNLSGIAGILILLSMFLLAIIRTRFIRKLVKLRTAIETYSQTKDTKIAESLMAEVTNEDEISIIMSKFADMIYELESYMKQLSRTAMALNNTQQKALELSILAIKDSLTGIRNKTGYDHELRLLEKQMAEGFTDFGVAMIDLNYLKRINDTYGHDKGNSAIISLCKLICNIFNHSAVFRIGGDEFVIILQGLDFQNVDELISDFETEIERRQNDDSLEYWEKTSAAIGYAAFNPPKDKCYLDVFKRADNEMYENKKAMKASRE